MTTNMCNIHLPKINIKIINYKNEYSKIVYNCLQYTSCILQVLQYKPYSSSCKVQVVKYKWLSTSHTAQVVWYSTSCTVQLVQNSTSNTVQLVQYK